jgi:hypothetical protein
MSKHTITYDEARAALNQQITLASSHDAKTKKWKKLAYSVLNDVFAVSSFDGVKEKSAMFHTREFAVNSYNAIEI